MLQVSILKRGGAMGSELLLNQIWSVNHFPLFFLKVKEIEEFMLSVVDSPYVVFSCNLRPLSINTKYQEPRNTHIAVVSEIVLFQVILDNLRSITGNYFWNWRKFPKASLKEYLWSRSYGLNNSRFFLPNLRLKKE